jgi:5-methylcytosine-specific restriction endonuclease McrA
MSRPGTALAAEVRQRTGGRCEYCRFPVEYTVMPFEIEHVIPLKHGGATIAANLAFACFYCNRYKGPNVAGIATPGAAVTRLFHPRLDVWEDHFAWEGAVILPRSEIGGATIAVLRMNQPNAVAVRQVLMSEGLW